MNEEIVSFTGITAESEAMPFYIQMSGISYCDGSYRIDRPESDIYCFEYIIKGQGTIHTRGKCFLPREGDLYILHRKDDHLYYSDARNPWTKIWFNIKGSLIDALIKVYGLEQVNHVTDVSGTLLPQLFQSFYQSCQEGKANSMAAFDKASILFHEILLQIHRCGLKPAPKLEDSAAVLRNYLDQHIENTVSIAEMASLIYKSPSQTIRIFKNAYGISPYEYLMDQKIQTAKLLLVNTGLSIKEISQYLHFGDEHYFSNYFKKRIGLSPKFYRNGQTIEKRQKFSRE